MSANNTTSHIPTKYSKAAYSNMQTLQHYLDFIEYSYNKELKNKIISDLQIPTKILKKKTERINLLLMSDFYNHLDSKNISPKFFFMMGMNNVNQYKKTKLQKDMLQVKKIEETFQYLIEEPIKFVEKNWDYNITKSTPDVTHIEIAPKNELLEELEIKSIPSKSICYAQSGFMAGIFTLMGLPEGNVYKVACRHQGDPVCKYHIYHAHLRSYMNQKSST